MSRSARHDCRADPKGVSCRERFTIRRLRLSPERRIARGELASRYQKMLRTHGPTRHGSEPRGVTRSASRCALAPGSHRRGVERADETGVRQSASPFHVKHSGGSVEAKDRRGDAREST